MPCRIGLALGENRGGAPSLSAMGDNNLNNQPLGCSKKQKPHCHGDMRGPTIMARSGGKIQPPRPSWCRNANNNIASQYARKVDSNAVIRLNHIESHKPGCAKNPCNGASENPSRPSGGNQPIAGKAIPPSPANTGKAQKPNNTKRASIDLGSTAPRNGAPMRFQ